ncbi:MAG: signal peptide peptidase SppA [Planctomycetaceae bacterium]
MTEEHQLTAGQSVETHANSVVIRVETAQTSWKSAGKRILISLLVASLMLNLLFIVQSASGERAGADGVRETHRSGSKSASDKLAIISVSGTIMPPFTERWIKQIRHAVEDDRVKGVLLEVDSPGGLVADSHQIYHELQKLVAKKPVYVAMKRLAASGGYYISMGIGTQGQIFVEPTTWTGSIGVIIPRYNATSLAEKIGVTSEPLVTGPLKDSLSPFRDLTDREQAVWKDIMDDAFRRFVGVIATNRPKLTEEQVRELATGQIYTADQAVANGMADHIGYSDQALESLAESLNLTSYNAVEYESGIGFIDLFLGARSESPPTVTEQLLDAAVPRHVLQLMESVGAGQLRP